MRTEEQMRAAALRHRILLFWPYNDKIISKWFILLLLCEFTYSAQDDSCSDGFQEWAHRSRQVPMPQWMSTGPQKRGRSL